MDVDLKMKQELADLDAYAQGQEDPVVELSTLEAPVVPAVPVVEPPVKTELQILMEQVADLQAKLSAKEAPPVVAPIEEAVLPQAVDFDPFAGTSYEEVISSKESFIGFIKNLVTKTQEASQETVYKNLPQLVKKYADEQIVAKTTAEKFYTANQDLVPFKADVAKAANLIANAQPGLQGDEFFKQVADYVRFTHKLIKEVNESSSQVPAVSTSPALNDRSAGKTTRLTSAPVLVGMEKEIADMLHTLND